MSARSKEIKKEALAAAQGNIKSATWIPFCDKHPDDHTKIECMDIQGNVNGGIIFVKKYLYKNGSNIGTCAMYPFWRFEDKNIL